jgi:hypothetical protein
MKYLFIVLVLVLTSLLTACSANKTTEVQAVPSSTKYVHPSGDASNILADLVDAINNQHLVTVLDLLSDDASFIEHYPVTLETNLTSDAVSTAYNGKGEIEEWLRDRFGPDTKITPKEYEMVADNSITMEGSFIYSDGEVSVELVAYTQDGMIRNLFIYKDH